MRGKHLLYCAILLTFRHVLSITEEYDVDQYCPLVRDGTKLPSFVSCGTYYICVKGKAVEQKCAAYQSFDKNAQSCKAAYLVRCDVEGENVCVGVREGLISAAGTCREWIECTDGVETGRGTCSDDQIFSGGRCQQGLCKPSDDSEFDYYTVCRIMRENMYFGSDADCSIWNICSSNNLISGSCEQPLVFDPSVGKCNYVPKTDCSRVKEEPLFPSYCSPLTVDIEPHRRKCSSYRQCVNGVFKIRQCPAGQYFDVLRYICRSRQLARTIETCDRCEDSRKPLVNAVDSNCQHYYTCDQGISTVMRACPAYTYFDEAAQACFEVADGNLNDYRQLNGACSFVYELYNEAAPATVVTD